ncbi:unnamed protein product [Heterobilharzia americana]|nr:unnamed protein product [Heterobilharzia americana]
MNIFEGPSAVEKIKAILSKRKTLFSFESCQKRVLYPEAIPHHRLGITLTPINTNGLAGPTTYNIQTTITHDLNKKPISSRGYTLGARTGPRLNTHHLNSGFPDPGAYQNFVNQSSIVKQNKKPFNQCAREQINWFLAHLLLALGHMILQVNLVDVYSGKETQCSVQLTCLLLNKRVQYQ